MNFGITSIDLEHLIELTKLASEVSLLEIMSLLNFKNLVKRAYDNGFRVIELTLDMAYVIPNSLTEDVAEELKEIKKKLNLIYTAHLPLWSIEPASPVPHIRDASVKSLAEIINIAEIFSPEVYVIHATGALASELSRIEGPPALKNIVNEMFYSNALKSVENLLEATGINSRRLAIENVEFEFKYTRKIVDELDTSICFDTGHLLAGYSGNYDVMEFLEWNYDKIAEIHLHDGYKIKKNGYVEIKDHIPLGEGKLPVCEFLTYLDKHNFKGPIIFELQLSWAKQSLDYIKKRCPNIKIE